MRQVVEVQQRGDLGVDAQDDVAALAAVAAIGSAKRFEFLALDGHTTVATITCGDMKGYAINECSHGAIFS